LDGSIPTKESPRYVEPLLIEAVDFDGGDSLNVTLVRARVFEIDGFDASRTITHTYFVGEGISDLFTLPVVSLATDPKFFFDSEVGIYENFWERGMKWEKPIHMAFYETDQHLAFEKEANVRIHGSGSRIAGQKSLRFYGENFLGEPPFFNYEIFPGYVASGTGESLEVFNTLLFRNSGHDNSFTLFRDALVHRLVAHTSQDIQAYRPVNVFINGEYWGIYNIRERIDEHYFENHYQISPDEQTIHKITANFDFYDQLPDANEFLNLRDFIISHDMADQENYAKVLTQVDIENFIDNQIIYIYAANGDWFRNNVLFWKKNVAEINTDALAGHDGRWRWAVIDLDYGFWAIEENMLAHALGGIPGALMANSLIKNDHFRVEFINRFADHLNTTFDSRRVISEIDMVENLLESDMRLHIQRWQSMGNSIDQWHENVAFLREFALARPNIVRGHIMEEFQLSGVYELSLNTDQNGGFVRVNSIDILESTPGVEDASHWSGMYFQGVPITLTAVPNPGYEFSHWEGVGEDMRYWDTITISPDADIQVTAIFQNN
jgi:hypothetical protein